MTLALPSHNFLLVLVAYHMRDHMEKLMDYPNSPLSSDKRVLTTRWHPSVTDAANLLD